MSKKQIGFLGLGNMGLNMVYNLLDKGYEVHAWNRSAGPRSKAEKAGATVYEDLYTLVSTLPKPRVIWSMVSAGEPVDQIIEQLTEGEVKLEKGDVFVDGVNSYYRDSIRRYDKLAGLGVHFLDCGVSGGITGARNGACIMVGGNKDIYREYIEQVVKDLSTKNGYGYFGEVGAGHFVKMVHNAIEYAMMQAIAEGMNLVDKSEYSELDREKLTDVWNHGSIISGNLMGFLKDALSKDPTLKKVDSEIGSLGTGEWAVREALLREVPFSGITNSVFARFNSRNKDDFGAKIVQALREEFGGHNSQERPNS